MELTDAIKSLRGIWTGFQAARVLLTANNLGVFEHLRKPITSLEAANLIKGDPRAVQILLDALTGIGVIEKRGQRYQNSVIAKMLLIKGSPHYQGDILRHADTMWHNWTDLDNSIKTGLPSRRKRDWDAFIKGMHNIAVLKADKVIDSIPLKGIKTAIDIGGGPGTYSIEMAKRGLSVTLFDFAETLKISRGIAHNQGIDGIAFQEGDITKDDIKGRFDLIFISQLFHAYSADENKKMLKKAAKALSPKGMVVVQEFFIEDSMTMPPESALFSINMLVQTTGGRCYSPREIKQWLKDSGFKGVTVKKPADTVVITARRSS